MSVAGMAAGKAAQTVASGSSYIRFRIKRPKGWKWMASEDIEVSLGPAMMVGGALTFTIGFLAAAGMSLSDLVALITGVPPDESVVPGLKYGPVFWNKWRGMDHASRMEYRQKYSLPDSWMPPGYPSMWD